MNFSDVPKLIGKLRTVRVNAGQPINIPAEFLGSPYPTATWLREGSKEPITEHKRVKIETTIKNSELTIDPSVRGDKGNYILVLSNFLQTLETPVHVEVFGKFKLTSNIKHCN